MRTTNKKPKPKPPWVNLPLGLVQYGDVGGWTTYRAHNGLLVWFPMTIPNTPPTEAQLAVRQLMKNSAQAWKALTNEQRAAYHLATKRLSLPMPPFALKYALDNAPNPNLKSTIERQAQVQLA